MNQPFDFSYGFEINGSTREDDVFTIVGYDPTRDTTVHRMIFRGICPQCSTQNNHAATVQYNTGMDLLRLEGSVTCYVCPETPESRLQMVVDPATLLY